MRNKSLQKGFAPIILIIIALVVFGLFIFSRFSNQNKTQNQRKIETSGSDTFEKLSSADNIPNCPTNTSNLFAKPFMDGDLPDFITPLGNSYTGGHVVPTDHVYPTDNNHASKVPVYAPGNLTLIWVEIKEVFDSKTNTDLGPDYQLNLAPCKGINMALIHLSSLSPALKETINESEPNCAGGKNYGGSYTNTPTYYKTCHPDFKSITIKAGDLLGTFGNLPGAQKPQNGFDIGMYNYNLPALKFINPDRYYTDTVHTVCPFDYFSQNLKQIYLGKMGAFEYDKETNQQKYFRRTIEPVCGSLMYDVLGTAAGDWFKNPIKQANFTDQDALVMIHDNIHPELARISTYNSAQSIFTPMHSGFINREFSEVKADGNIYCYPYSLGNQSDQKVLIRLLDDTHIKMENQQGSCGGSESFKNPLVYER
jgi:hypothetical protein